MLEAGLVGSEQKPLSELRPHATHSGSETPTGCSSPRSSCIVTPTIPNLERSGLQGLLSCGSYSYNLRKGLSSKLPCRKGSSCSFHSLVKEKK